MKANRLASTLILGAAFASGAVMAQSSAPTTPSTTPNDSTATPLNNSKVPPGTPAPAPYEKGPSTTNPVMRDSSGGMKSDSNRPREPSDMGNTNVSPTQGGGAPYPNTDKK